MNFQTASRIATIALLCTATAADAEATGVSPSGFLVTHRAEVAAAPAAVFAAVTQVSQWWSSAHTYSQDAANLSIDARAGGCFCERWGENSIEHLRVIYVARGQALRLEGALGPLQPMAVTGILTFVVAAGTDGKSVLTLAYRVRGAEANLDKMAGPVDHMLGEQFARLVEVAAAK
jgi:uncharacterized protein YndB with AHSA1/START domain